MSEKVEWLELNKLVRLAKRIVIGKGPRRNSLGLTIPIDCVESLKIEQDDEVEWYGVPGFNYLLVLRVIKTGEAAKKRRGRERRKKRGREKKEERGGRSSREKEEGRKKRNIKCKIRG